MQSVINQLFRRVAQISTGLRESWRERQDSGLQFFPAFSWELWSLIRGLAPLLLALKGSGVGSGGYSKKPGTRFLMSILGSGRG